MQQFKKSLKLFNLFKGFVLLHAYSLEISKKLFVVETIKARSSRALLQASFRYASRKHVSIISNSIVRGLIYVK